MIGKLTGKIEDASQNPIILDVHGVGYLVHVTEQFLHSVTNPATGALYIHSHIREDAFDLYGFPTLEDLRFFELLLTVSGVGPKTALLVINRGVDMVRTAALHGDVAFFTSIPRLGTKNAQKIIIELKGKLDLSNDSGDTKQVTDALIGMGFARHEIHEALKKLTPEDRTIEQKLTHALKLLAR